MIEKITKEILDKINKSETIVIAGHVNPDGDAIGSCLALYIALIKMGKKPIVLLDKIHDKFKIIPMWEIIDSNKIDNIVPDLFFVLDSGNLDRIAEHSQKIFKKSKTTINIDHHISNSDFADFNYVIRNASSTCEVIFDIINKLVDIDKDIASCIYAGIVYDTGGFRHGMTSYKTHEIAGICHKAGIEFNKIYNQLIIFHSEKETKLLGKCVERMEFDREYKILHSFITLEDFTKFEASKGDTDSLVTHLIATDSIDTVFFAYEIEKDVFKLSFRTRALHMDVNKVANVFSGGGHINAAGCTIKGSIESIVSKVLFEIRKEKDLIKLNEK